MKLENRVDALEQELKILKNEIQSVLLEIREQVLNHYYPELRGEEPMAPQSFSTQPTNPASRRNGSKNSGSNNGSNGNGRAKPHGLQAIPLPDDEAPIAQPGATHPFSDISLQDILGDEPFDTEFDTEFDTSFDSVFEAEADEAEPDDTDLHDTDLHDTGPRDTGLPHAREVAMNQLRNGRNGSKAAHSAGAKALAAKAEKRPTFAALATWVAESVAKAGKDRTVQVVDTYTVSGGRLSDETRSAILQLVALANDEQPLQPPSNQEMMGLLVQLDEIVNG